MSMPTRSNGSCGTLAARDSLILSVHPHNDRGTAVAAAELAVMAGAERIEGTLFGNGERHGQCRRSTLALNLYSQGVIQNWILRTSMKPHAVPRPAINCPSIRATPTWENLVFTAFSGSHQDAIKKGLAARSESDIWDVPYTCPSTPQTSAAPMIRSFE